MANNDNYTYMPEWLIDAVDRYLTRTYTSLATLAMRFKNRDGDPLRRELLWRYINRNIRTPKYAQQQIIDLILSDPLLPDDEKQQLTALAGMERQQLIPYLDWLEREYQFTELLGIADEQVQLDLQQVYVPLRVVSRNEFEDYRRKMRGESPQGGAVGDREGKSVFTLLSDPPGDDQPVTTRRLLLLGEAGSGKTMTLRYTALRLAAAYRANDPDQLVDPAAGLYLKMKVVPLPIYISLNLFAETLPEDAGQWSSVSPNNFLTWIDQQASRGCGLQEGILSGLIRRNNGRVMLLLDGLDEVGEHQRAYLAQKVISPLARRYEKQRYLVACRTEGYGKTVILQPFHEWRWHLSPLNDEEKQRLLTNWFHTVDKRLATMGRQRQDAAADQVAQLWDAIKRSKQLREIATNPLLLTAIALLQYNQVRLPDQRAKLYEKLITLLLDLRRKQNVASALFTMTGAQRSSERRRVEALALAMQQQERQVREVTLMQAQEWLAPWYVEELKINREEANERVQDLLNRMSIDRGIIQLWDDRYSFVHYTFQEYMAARGLDALDYRPNQPDSVAFLLERSGESRWRETLLLAAGAWSDGQQWPKVDQLLAGLLARGEPKSVLLAGDVLVDTGEIEELTQRRSEVTDRLRTLIANTPDHSLRESAEAILRKMTP